MFGEEVERIRVGSRIYLATGELEMDHKSINKAKRASREWQSRTGKCGDGRLRVSEKPPKQAQGAA